METKIFLGGLGGQGVVMGGKLLGMATVRKGGFATSYSEYAPAMRNGYTYTTLILSEKEVGAQVTSSYDCMAFFDEDSCVTQSPYLKENGCYLVNTSLVKTMPDTKRGKLYQIPASEIADELGNPRFLNVIMMGAIVEASNCLEPEEVEAAIRESFGKKPQVALANIQAFQRGRETVRSQKNRQEGEE